jgi:opacity protein-like surface antigen
VVQKKRKSFLKFPFAAIVCLFLVFQASGQAAKPVFGISAGFNISRMLYNSTNADFPTYYKPGYSVGISADFPVYRKISLQTELGYNLLGTRMGDFSNGRNHVSSVNLNYLSMSLIPKWHIGKDLSVYTGAGVNYNLQTTIFYTKYDNAASVDDIYLPFDVSGIAGAEYYFSKGIGFSARFLWSTLNIADNWQSVGYVYNRAFVFSALFKIQ